MHFRHFSRAGKGGLYQAILVHFYGSFEEERREGLKHIARSQETQAQNK